MKFKKIIFVAVISLLIGFIHIYPDLKFIYELGSNFKGITFNATQDAAIYLGRINNVYKGDTKTIPTVDIYEHRQEPWTLPFLGELLLGSIGSGMHIPLNYFKIIFSFLLPIIDFWLIYYFAFLLYDSKSVAIVTAFTTTLGYSFFSNNPVYIFDLIFKKEVAIQLWFLRPIAPQFNYILLLMAWILLYFLMIRKRFIYAVLGGISIGSFFYIGGPYYLAYFFVFVGLLFCLSAIKRDYPLLKKITIIPAIIIIFAIPYAINYIKLASLAQYKYFMERTAIMYGHKPIIPMGIAVASLFVGWFHYSRKTPQAKFIILFMLSGFICLNQQLITGVTSQPAHWQNHMVKTFALITLFPTAALFLREKKYIYSTKTMLKNIAISGFIILAILQQENYYQRFKNRFTQMQKLAGPFDWLAKNTKREDVVLNDPMNFKIGDIPYQQDFLMYAKNYVYLPSVQTTLVSLEEVEHRYLSALRFFNYTLSDAGSFFTYWNGIAFRGMIAEISFGGTPMPDSYLLHLKNKYSEFLKKDPISLLSRYKVNYVILGRLNPFYSKIDTAYPRLLKVYDDGEFKIYKIPI